MSLNPSHGQTAPDLRAPLHALVVVAPDGRIQFATERAQSWLREFSFSPSDRLPPAVADWLEEAMPSSRLSRFIVDRPGIRVSIQILFRETGSVCLLLEQEAERRRSNGAGGLLTRRQTEVLSWVARGKTNAEIAAILRLKTGTIGKYLERIFPKLGVENRTAAASFVLGTNKTT
jgi:DNA-binding CsgD family transcriptional regulator